MTNSICLFSAFYPPHQGGIENYTQSLANELCRHNSHVTIVTSQDNSDLPIIEKSPSKPIKVIRIPSLTLMNNRFPLIVPSPKAIQIWQSLKDSSFDLIVVNARYYPLSLFGLALAKKTGTHAILIDHSSSYLATNKSLIDRAIKQYEHWISNRIHRFNPDCYGVSTRSCEWLAHIGFQPLGTLPNAINPSEYCSIRSERSFKSELQLPPTTPIVSFVGRLVPEKGALKVALAAQKIITKHPEAQFLIGGSGPELSSIKKYNFSNVHLLGSLSRNDVSALLHESNIFCFPTDYPEGLPTVLLEAAAHKCAVITSDTGGATDLIPNDRYGHILANTEVNTITAALLEYLGNPLSARNAGTNLYRYICENFTWNDTANKLLAICDKS